MNILINSCIMHGMIDRIIMNTIEYLFESFRARFQYTLRNDTTCVQREKDNLLMDVHIFIQKRTSNIQRRSQQRGLHRLIQVHSCASTLLVTAPNEICDASQENNSTKRRAN